MRRDLLMWGLALFGIGLVLTWAIPDGADDDIRSARSADEVGAGPNDTTTDNVGWGDWLGWLAMLAGVGVALVGLFKDERIIASRHR
jgi:hypothetical protein